VLKAFAESTGLQALSPRELEDEFVWRNSYKLNDTFYASLGDKRAFVLSHGRDQLVFKIVGYAEQNVEYYKLQDFRAHVWIAHQRYPTKAACASRRRAPVRGLNEALVHNGDFANYHSVCEYLRQRNIKQQFLTDTEVSVQLFDLWDRVYKYPLEYIIEALAPTAELDFDQLPPEKQRIYRQIQATHIHASPDGPWFFIIARNHPDQKRMQLLGITDTAMLRPQVFALADSGDVQIGLICSEKQAIDATLRSLAREDPRFCPVADKYWNARGGSSTDGGTFVFTINDENGKKKLSCADKFGRQVKLDVGNVRCDQVKREPPIEIVAAGMRKAVLEALKQGRAQDLFTHVVQNLPGWPASGLRDLLRSHRRVVRQRPQQGHRRRGADSALRSAIRYRRQAAQHRAARAGRDADATVRRQPASGQPGEGSFRRLNWDSRATIVARRRARKSWSSTQRSSAEGDDCDAIYLRRAFQAGWRRFIGLPFAAASASPAWDWAPARWLAHRYLRSSGDYLASGMDGEEIRVHGNARIKSARSQARHSW